MFTISLRDKFLLASRISMPMICLFSSTSMVMPYVIIHKSLSQLDIQGIRLFIIFYFHTKSPPSFLLFYCGYNQQSICFIKKTLPHNKLSCKILRMIELKEKIKELELQVSIPNFTKIIFPLPQIFPIPNVISFHRELLHPLSCT